MATQNLGRVGLVLKGEWDRTTDYTALDVVSHDGNAWAAKQNNTNVEPTTANSDFWQLFSNNADLVATVQGLKEDAANSAAAAAASAQYGEDAFNAIAHTFDPGVDYTAGKYVWYNGELYRFNVAHPAGAWIGTDAARYTATDEFLLIQQALDTKADAAEVDDLKSALSFPDEGVIEISQSQIIQGTYNASGDVVSSDTRIRTIGFIPVYNGEKIRFASGTNITQVFYGSFSHSKTFISDGIWSSGGIININWDGYIILVWRKSANNENIVPSDYDAQTQFATNTYIEIAENRSALNEQEERTTNNFRSLAQDGSVSELNPANMFPDPTFGKGLWGAQNGIITLSDTSESLSKIATLTRENTQSGGYITAIMRASDFTDGATYRIKISQNAVNTQLLAIRQNTDGIIGHTKGWILTDVAMTLESTSSGRWNYYYDWTVSESSFDGYEYIQIQFKVTSAPVGFYEPFIGNIIENTDYIVTYKLPSAFEILEPINIFEGEFYSNHYYGPSYTERNNFNCAKPQLLDAGSYLCIINKSFFGASLQNKVFKFNSDDGTTGAVSPIPVTLLQEIIGNDATYGIYQFTIAEQQYVGINIGYGELDPKGFMLVKGDNIADWPESYLYYFAPYQVVAEPSKLNELMMGQVSPIYGKKVAVNGDSICAGAGELGGFMKPIAGHNNMICSNIAVSGGTLASGTTYSGGGNRHWISATIKDMPTGFDYYIFEGGVNDFANSVPMGGTVQLGALTNGFPVKGAADDNIDNTTVIGAVEYACRDLVTLFPGKKYGFVFVHGIFPYTGDIYPLWHTQFKPGIKSALEKWGIPYIDLEELAPPLNLIPSLKSAYTASGDGWHPNAAGYAAFYTDKIKAWMEGL